MSRAAINSVEWGRATSSAPIVDKSLIVPTLVCVYVTIVSPLIYFMTRPATHMAPQVGIDSDLLNRIFWPAMAAISVALAVRNRSRLTLPPHIVCLFACLVFAGASVLWAFKPEISFVRFVMQAMIVTSIVLPILLAVRTADMMRGVFLCLAFGSILNVLFIGSPFTVYSSTGYEGYLAGKNALGQFAAIVLLLALHEMLYPGRRRALGVIIVVIATSLLFLSGSKTSLGLVLFVPLLAGLTLIVRRTMRISPAIVLLSISVAYVVLSNMSVFDMYRLSYLLYGDATLSGRTVIWDFVLWEIAHRPYLGWGYQSFWLVGVDGPSIVDARGWVRLMPHAHNGYLDMILQMGYVGLGLLVIFIFVTFHAIGRVADRDPARAWLVLSIALFIALHNFLESTWMRGSDFLWVVFLIVAADIGRYWRPSPLIRAAYGSRPPKPGSVGLSRGARRPRGGSIEVEGISGYRNRKFSGSK